jgi:uroporphyrin-III C-methyltransferase
MTGTVYLVGAGPGAPDLITIRAAKVLARADIVFHDALVHPEIVALAQRAIHVPVGKRCGKLSAAQRFINKRLVDAVQRHHTVVRLKGGDPMLFGRAQEEIAALQTAGVHYEVVPGVTAALAASAELGISLTRRGVSRSVALVTPRAAVDEVPNNWVQSVVASDTAVLYMARDQAARIAESLIAAGKPPRTPVAVVENASLPNVRSFVTTLEELPAIADVDLRGPATILIGEVYRQGKGSSVDIPLDDPERVASG